MALSSSGESTPHSQLRGVGQAAQPPLQNSVGYEAPPSSSLQQGTTSGSDIVAASPAAPCEEVETESSIESFPRFQRILWVVREMFRCNTCKCRHRKPSSGSACCEDEASEPTTLDIRVERFIGQACEDFCNNSSGPVKQEVVSEWELGPDVAPAYQQQPLGEYDNCDVWSEPSSTPSEWSHAHENYSQLEYAFHLGPICSSDPKFSQASQNSMLSSTSTVSQWSASSCRNPPAPPKALIARGDSIYEEPESELTLDSLLDSEWPGFSEYSGTMKSIPEGPSEFLPPSETRTNSHSHEMLSTCTDLPKPLPPVISL